jgi:Skp family chaperone for outer membrane proteins
VRSFQVQRGEQALEQEVEFWTNAQRRENEVLLDRSVRRIHAACEEYGQRTGVSAVLMRPGPLPPEGDPRNALRDLEGRWVVWAHPDHDVTEAVLAILHEQG